MTRVKGMSSTAITLASLPPPVLATSGHTATHETMLYEYELGFTITSDIIQSLFRATDLLLDTLRHHMKQSLFRATDLLLDTLRHHMKY
ncbi:unnamed protein product [Medioppia subpectinata]|uniref:Uncharacterized protein n=1 Tax=Medioppia subpectinata TaxID=1979941 RepID=A0A7R9QDA4_9ACAR|nr:unnamed protein product [Medioppia subpectinata]CAG2118044.1 unnamed protein product [Medioppia subpectinata]